MFLSSSDRNFLGASMARIGVTFTRVLMEFQSRPKIYRVASLGPPDCVTLTDNVDAK